MHYKCINVLVTKICFNSINNIKRVESASLEIHYDNLHAVQSILIKIYYIFV